MALSTKVDLSVAAILTKAPVAGNYPTDNLNLIKNYTYTSGTGAGQADVLYYAERTLTASSNEDLDLTGSLTNNLGQTVTQARIKGLTIIAAPSDPSATQNTNSVVVGAAASNQWATLFNAAGTVTLRPGAMASFWAGPADATGWAVTGSTGDLLRVANSAGGSSVTYQIYVVGCSA